MKHGHSSGVTNLQQVAVPAPGLFCKGCITSKVFASNAAQSSWFCFFKLSVWLHHGDAVIGDVGTQKRGGVPSL